MINYKKTVSDWKRALRMVREVREGSYWFVEPADNFSEGKIAVYSHTGEVLTVDIRTFRRASERS